LTLNGSVGLWEDALVTSNSGLNCEPEKVIRGVNKGSLGGINFFNVARFFFNPPYENIMMCIKLLVLVGFDLHFSLISGIYKLHQIKASSALFYTRHYSHSFYINYKDL